ncbi:redox-regulated ATPase YchF [candidate division CPR3 bacterium 4484_211]|uniref:Redox-regulated ATPase YchF n=1 Tax=candidate division CPR3 bacterium 4484_211 TaxID=1968527 RepID=A0A1W9NYS5_UNCC3|nr:MAG: redox-regulated ATPase YchF [candidate division CPR3 bacterium 4484_211]
MTLSIGIVGLPNVGKSTLFNALLSKQIADTSPYPFCTKEPNVGVVEIPDSRPQKLSKMEKSKRVVPAVIKFVDIAGLVKDAHKGAGLGNQFLAHIREVDAIIHVLRLFKNESVGKAGKIKPTLDYQTVATELIFADLATLEKQKKPKPPQITKEDQSRWEVIQRAKKLLNDGTTLVRSDLSDKEKALLSSLHLLTLKPELIVLNIDESQYSKQKEILDQFAAFDAVAICARLECDLGELNDEERREYLQTLNLAHYGLEQLILKTFKLLNLVTFFTVNQNEAHSWIVKEGTTALNAAGEIHTDMQKGFIKAAVCPFETFIKHGGWKKSLEDGAVRFEGKDYLVQEGDVVEFRFK